MGSQLSSFAASPKPPLNAEHGVSCYCSRWRWFGCRKEKITAPPYDASGGLAISSPRKLCNVRCKEPEEYYEHAANVLDSSSVPQLYLCSFMVLNYNANILISAWFHTWIPGVGRHHGLSLRSPNETRLLLLALGVTSFPFGPEESLLLRQALK